MEKLESLKQFTAAIIINLPSSFEILTEPVNEVGPFKVRNKETGEVFIIELSANVESPGVIELINEDTGIKYEFSGTTAEETGVRIFKLRNKESGVEVNFVEPNENLDVSSLIASLGASTSRKDMSLVQIAEGFVEKETDSSVVLEKIYNEYKHDSPAGMAYVTMAIDNISIANCFALFYYLSVGDGQELSTRYVKFVLKEILLNPKLVEELGEEYRDEILGLMEGIQNYEVENYKEWIEKLEAAYRKFFEEQKAQAAVEGNQEVLNLKTKKPVENRSLDIARQFVPLGALTKFYLVASARIWRNLITRLRESEDISQRKLAEDIALMFRIGSKEEVAAYAPEIVHPRLINHSEAKFTVKNASEKLKGYLNTLPGFDKLLETRNLEEREGTRSNLELYELGNDSVAFMYIIGLYPDIDTFKLWNFLLGLDDFDKGVIGEIIYEGHGRHDEMTNKADVRSYQTFIIETAVSYLRDYDRHRATGRMMTLFENGDIDVILNEGFNRNFQINETSFLKQFSEAWDESFSELYRKLRELNEILKSKGVDKALRREIVLNHIPLGHQTKMFMTIPDSQLTYLTTTRGALKETADRDSGYVEVTKLMIQALNEQNPYFRKQFRGQPTINHEDPIDLATRG